MIMFWPSIWSRPIKDENQAINDELAKLEERFIEATEVKSGITIRTKDGRKFGNAYIIEQLARSPVPHEVAFLCETDFGNRITLSLSEIETQFWLGFAQTYDEWFDARLECIRKGIEE
jgi:hypothetical protein